MIRAALISVAIALSVTSASAAQDARLLSGNSAADVIAADGFEINVFARRLGDVTAMARHQDGTLYVAERSEGRIFRIQDRGLDGSADITQPLAHRFDRPTGLVLMGDALLITDRSGLWRINAGGGTPNLIAPFARAGSTGDPHPIVLLGPDRLLLGMNRTDGTIRLVEIEIASGVAHLREDGPGQIIGFSTARSEDGEFPVPWVLLQRGTGTHFGQSLQRARNIGQDVSAVWLDEAQGRAIIALPDRVSTTVATFAGIRDTGQTMVSGFNNAANGVRPGVMLADQRGLFVSDQAGGRIWLIYKTPEAEPVEIETEEIETIVPTPEPLPTRPDLLRGSGITRASTIGPASTLKPADQPSAEAPPKE